MALKTFKTKDEVPEAQRDNALALADGTFAVVEDTDTTAMQAEVTEWKRKHEAAERLAKKAAADLLVAQNNDKAAKAGVTGEELAKIRAEVKAEVLAELNGDLEKGRAALQENRTLKLDAKVRALAAANGVRAERLGAWWKLHGEKFDLTEDGTPIVRAHPGVTLDKFIATECKAEMPELYVGSMAAGGGGNGGNGLPTPSSSRPDVLANPGAALASARAAGKTE